MGTGRDGGRDLYHRGSLIWKPIEDQPGEVWDGYTVLQVKHMAAPSSKHKENLTWLWGQVRGELDAWADPEGGRNPVPDYLIVITNVMLTPFPVVGGHDVLDANIASYLERLKDNRRDTGEAAKAQRKDRLARLSRIKKVRAPDRYSLFRGYYDTVFRRERDKPAGLHKMLQEYGQQIQQLHERVGFELQVRSEAGDRSYATLTPDELRQIAWQVLDEAGFKPSGKDAGLVEKIFDAATKRLVLIAPRGTDGYGFDVRSLQELMAAMRLTTGLDGVLQRLRAAAASPFWRNTWLFAAGQLFSTPQPHQHEAVVSLVETIDQSANDRLGRVVPVGPWLALDIIDDGMARSYPKWRDRLIAHGMKVLWEPDPPDLPSIAKYLVRFANTGTDQRAAVAEGLRAALEGTPAAWMTATHLQQLIPTIADEIHAQINVRSLSGIRKRPYATPPSEPVNGWEDFETEIAANPCTGEAARLLHEGANAVRHISAKAVREEDTVAIERTLEVGVAAAGLAAALVHVVHEQELVKYLRDSALPGVHRRPIGEQLRSMTR